MVHRARIAVVLAGCGFHGPSAVVDGPAGLPNDVSIDAPIDASDDAPVDARTVAFCDPGDATLIACFAFEGTTSDGTVHHHDPTVAVNVGFGTGAVGQGLRIGSQTEVDVADSSAFDVTAFTIESWIAPQLASFSSTRGGILDCEGQYGFFVQSTGAISCSGNGAVTTTALVPSGQWTHVACVHDANTLTVYINGAVAQSTSAGALATGGTTGITLGGNNPPGSGDPLVGMLDQLRYYNAARTAAQICADSGKTSCP